MLIIFHFLFHSLESKIIHEMLNWTSNKIAYKAFKYSISCPIIQYIHRKCSTQNKFHQIDSIDSWYFYFIFFLCSNTCEHFQTWNSIYSCQVYSRGILLSSLDSSFATSIKLNYFQLNEIAGIFVCLYSVFSIIRHQTWGQIKTVSMSHE